VSTMRVLRHNRRWRWASGARGRASSYNWLAAGGAAALGVALSACGDRSRPIEVRIPVDERPTSASSPAPPAISGGTLTVLKDGSSVAVSDADRDRVSIVDLGALTVRHSILLEPGDEPGRSVEDATGNVHVVLRGGGAVVSLDAVTGRVLGRRPVCKGPRGIAFDSAQSLLYVTCVEGRLVTLPAAGGAPTRSLTLAADLRDVLVGSGGKLRLTRFKSAEILDVDPLSFGVQSTRTIAALQTEMTFRLNSSPAGTPVTRPVTLQPHVAWRAAQLPDGRALIAHQLAVLDEVPVESIADEALASPYGGNVGTCNGIVKQAITTVSGADFRTRLISGSPLPVDIAVSSDSQWVAVAHAAPLDPMAPRRSTTVTDESGESFTAWSKASGNGLSIFAMSSVVSGGSCITPRSPSPVTEPVVAVAFALDGRLLAQTREPPALIVLDAATVSPRFSGAPTPAPLLVQLPGESRLDTGHELFHRDSGGGIACASCHPEGDEDSHTWAFVGIGPRRTQALRVGLRDTAPFHWGGDLTGVGDVMAEVFVNRMGGNRQSDARLGTLSEWLFSLKPLPARRDAADPAAVRGRTLFESDVVGCAECHGGPKLTNNETVSIDRAREPLQVPSLVGIAHRSPFMHDGCAPTLDARFTLECGGNEHGNLSSLAATDLSDLVAYLETL
jgi:hypothetical protein